MSVRYPVSKSVLDWAVEKSGQDIAVLESKLPKLEDWRKQLETTDNGLSISNIKALSKALNIPFGYFFIKELPKDNEFAISYRSIENKMYHHPSRDLQETIADMQKKQDYVRNYRKENQDQLDFVGSYNINSSFLDIANDIRVRCDLPLNWNLQAKNKREAIKYLHSSIEPVGILLFKNGIVQSNTHRPLNLEEFRAFVLVDTYAPLIFINTQDSLSGQLFSICHELAHIWLGQEEILNDSDAFGRIQYGQTKHSNMELERLANKVAAELLMPKQNILGLFDSNFTLANIEKVSTKLKISQQAVAIGLLDGHFISKTKFDELFEVITRNTETTLDNKKSSGAGGDYYNNYFNKIDYHFFDLVSTQAEEGNLSYTDAYDLLNIKSGKIYTKTLHKFEERI